jgi:hypothetical protein
MPTPDRARLHFGLLADAEATNRALREGYERWAVAPETRRTHYFGGRFENVYIPFERISALAPVLAEARRLAGEALALDPGRLRVGFWFNAMEPAQRTLPHTHDDADELLSGVYYVETPPGSGELVVGTGDARTTVPPRPGLFVLFSPAILHEVTVHRGTGLRLSIGMNFGLVEGEECGVRGEE